MKICGHGLRMEICKFVVTLTNFWPNSLRNQNTSLNLSECVEIRLGKKKQNPLFSCSEFLKRQLHFFIPDMSIVLLMLEMFVANQGCS